MVIRRPAASALAKDDRIVGDLLEYNELSLQDQPATILNRVAVGGFGIHKRSVYLSHAHPLLPSEWIGRDPTQ
jgi:hypothetical protein